MSIRARLSFSRDSYGMNWSRVVNRLSALVPWVCRSWLPIFMGYACVIGTHDRYRGKVIGHGWWRGEDQGGRGIHFVSECAGDDWPSYDPGRIVHGLDHAPRRPNFAN